KTRIKMLYAVWLLRPIIGTVEVRAWLLIPLWFALQIAFAVVFEGEGVAYWAHVGGFLAGVAGALIMRWGGWVAYDAAPGPPQPPGGGGAARRGRAAPPPRRARLAARVPRRQALDGRELGREQVGHGAHARDRERAARADEVQGALDQAEVDVELGEPREA